MLCVADDDNLPSYPVRLALAKLCIEVERLKDAITVLDRLLFEDDTNTEVWFLIAACFRDTGRPATARKYLATLLQV